MCFWTHREAAMPGRAYQAVGSATVRKPSRKHKELTVPIVAEGVKGITVTNRRHSMTAKRVPQWSSTRLCRSKLSEVTGPSSLAAMTMCSAAWMGGMK